MNGTIIWQEDDCAPLSEREDVWRAFRRITYTNYSTADAVSEKNHGDATHYLMPTGHTVVVSYPGNSCIYEHTKGE